MSSNNNELTSIILKTNDNQLFKVEKAVAMEMGAVKIFLEDNHSLTNHNCITMPLLNVSSGPLTHIISYITKYLELREADKDIETYNSEFLKDIKIKEIWDMVLATHYLDSKYLFDILAQAVADHIKDKSVEYVRGFFGIEDSEFTKDEEEKFREEYAWAFEVVDED